MGFVYLFKLILIGDQSVGKSSALLRFTDEKFGQDCEATVGVQFASKAVQVKGVPLKLQMWDTAGQETFRSITRAYYRGTVAALLFYDVTSRRSFDNLTRWLEEARNYCTCDQMVFAIIGNKIDLHDREVTTEEGRCFAAEQGVMFFECSANSGRGVDEVFLDLSSAILEKVEKGEIDPQDENGGVRIGDIQPSPKKVKGKCC